MHPGADPSQINLLYDGQNPLTLLDDGSISIQTPLGSLKEEKPFTYEQEGDIEVKSSYQLTTISNNKTLLKFNLVSMLQLFVVSIQSVKNNNNNSTRTSNSININIKVTVMVRVIIILAVIIMISIEVVCLSNSPLPVVLIAAPGQPCRTSRPP